MIKPITEMTRDEIEVIEKQLYSLLDKVHAIGDVFINSMTGIITVTIEDGDWKHQHQAFKSLLQDYYISYIGEYVIGDSDDDSYTAEHLLTI